MKTQQLELIFEDNDPVYYNANGDPLPWEEEKAKKEGWKGGVEYASIRRSSFEGYGKNGNS